MELNTQLMDSLQMYHGLMRDLPAYGYTTVSSSMQQPPPYMSLAQVRLFEFQSGYKIVFLISIVVDSYVIIFFYFSSMGSGHNSVEVDN